MERSEMSGTPSSGIPDDTDDFSDDDIASNSENNLIMEIIEILDHRDNTSAMLSNAGSAAIIGGIGVGVLAPAFLSFPLLASIAAAGLIAAKKNLSIKRVSVIEKIEEIRKIEDADKRLEELKYLKSQISELHLVDLFSGDGQLERK